MNKALSLLLLTFFITIVFSIESSEVSGVSIKTEHDLANFLKVLLGENNQNIRQDLKEFITENKLSVMNAAQEIAIILKQDEERENNENSFELTEEFTQAMGNSLTKVTFYDMVDKNEDQIKEFKEKNPKKGCKYYEMSTNPEQGAKIAAMMRHHKKRLLQETQTVSEADISSSYITKFFFGLLFFLVTIELFFAIACMQNKKDSLLYAKFIADVGR